MLRTENSFLFIQSCHVVNVYSWPVIGQWLLDLDYPLGECLYSFLIQFKHFLISFILIFYFLRKRIFKLFSCLFFKYITSKFK